MENTFVIQTDDKSFKESLSEFLSKHCDDNDVNAVIYEMNKAGADEVMQVVKES